jgi:anthranilate synthase component 1
MIVDLMRNDLGRVCEFGSVCVDQPRAFEHHGGREGGVIHSVATVSGRVREDVTIEQLLRATFPGGSVTGAPKVRAMQIVEELEGTSRGPYTGSIGYVSDCGRACFNIAIRTAFIEGDRPRGGAAGTLDHVEDASLIYRVGAGIVAESDPVSEWEETLAKARFFTDLAGPDLCPIQASPRRRSASLVT